MVRKACHVLSCATIGPLSPRPATALLPRRVPSRPRAASTAPACPATRATATRAPVRARPRAAVFRGRFGSLGRVSSQCWAICTRSLAPLSSLPHAPPHSSARPGTPDVNECARAGRNNCSAAATCTNTPGGFMCACKPGYAGDGYACTGAPVVEGDCVMLRFGRGNDVSAPPDGIATSCGRPGGPPPGLCPLTHHCLRPPQGIGDAQPDAVKPGISLHNRPSTAQPQGKCKPWNRLRGLLPACPLGCIRARARDLLPAF